MQLTFAKIFKEKNSKRFHSKIVFPEINMIHSIYKNKMIRHTIIFLLCFIAIFSAHAQVNQVVYGKNRVQYHRFFDDWSQYESENFITYFYGQSRFVAQATAMLAETDFDVVQKIVEYRLNEKLEIIVYSDISDLHQSNIGQDEIFLTENKSVKVVGSKIFVYFDGDHLHLRQMVREGIASVYINTMLFGNNLQEVVQNALSFNLPAWFKEGLVDYVGNEWNTDLDDQMRALTLTKKYKNFDKFAIAEPRLAGHAFFNFISQQYGKANVANLLYLTRVNRSLEEAMMYVMNNTNDALTLASMEFYKRRYENEQLKATDIGRWTLDVGKKQKGANSNVQSPNSVLKIKNKFKLPILQSKLSPDGKRLAYVLNEQGKWKIYIQDVRSGKREMIFKGGTRNALQATDYNYPLLAWNPDNQRLFAVYESHDVRKQFTYNPKEKKKPKLIENFAPDFQRVYSIDFMNPRDLVITAATAGVSDIFIYNTVMKNGKRITNDFWDDLDAVYAPIHGKKGIIFSSNRITDTLETEKFDTVVPTAHFNLFFKDLEDTSRNLVRITNSLNGDNRQGAIIDSVYFSFLSDESGIYNRQIGFLEERLVRTDTIFYGKNNFKEKTIITVMQDSVRTFSDTMHIDSVQLKPIYKTVAVIHNSTNYNHNIATQNIAPRAGVGVERFDFTYPSRLHIFKVDIDTAVTPDFTRYWLIQQILKKIKQPKQNTGDRSMSNPGVTVKENNTAAAPPVNLKRDTSKKVDIDHYVFQSEFDDKDKSSDDARRNKDKATNNPATIQKEEDTAAPAIKPEPLSPANVFLQNDKIEDKKNYFFKQSRIIPYRLKFRNDFYSTKLDNSLLFGGLDSYAGTPQTYAPPPLGILMKANFKDLLEDYQLEGGIRVPTNITSGYEAYAFFDDRKRRFDKRYAFYHKSARYSDNSTYPTSESRTTTNLAQYTLSYPFDVFSRLAATASARFDRYSPLASDRTSLDSIVTNEQRLGIKLEYIFDNTIDVDVNLKYGTRYKVWVDVAKKMNLDLDNKPSFKFANGFLGTFGFDARHYERILKYSVLAIRAAGAFSFGDEKTLYILGGTDNQLFAKYNDNVSTPPDNYAFQTLAANMRGFVRNIRNGTSYALINAELRVPIFKYLSSRPLASSFLRNFQVIGFFDIGSAWHGSNPFSRINPLNTLVLPKDQTNAPVVVTVNYFKDPIVAAYGVGARAYIFGYTLRADYGWGIETRVVQKPLLHFSLGTDF